ncbi:hypothetical protein EYF80_065700 [Liparis tanakae]|uniref:Uncharacterized protein n=1 Tax=Liparis tanakae TaxID=230148 RepID=A0A4Z2E5W3_9TELE|nr:hypothetical protein EYF80_065700 [Liparis tanakae]
MRACSNKQPEDAALRWDVGAVTGDPDASPAEASYLHSHLNDSLLRSRTGPDSQQRGFGLSERLRRPEREARPDSRCRDPTANQKGV